MLSNLSANLPQIQNSQHNHSAKPVKKLKNAQVCEIKHTFFLFLYREPVIFISVLMEFFFHFLLEMIANLAFPTLILKITRLLIQLKEAQNKNN